MLHTSKQSSSCLADSPASAARAVRGSSGGILKRWPQVAMGSTSGSWSGELSLPFALMPACLQPGRGARAVSGLPAHAGQTSMSTNKQPYMHATQQNGTLQTNTRNGAFLPCALLLDIVLNSLARPDALALSGHPVGGCCHDRRELGGVLCRGMFEGAADRGLDVNQESQAAHSVGLWLLRPLRTPPFPLAPCMRCW